MAGAESQNQVVEVDELKQAIEWIESFQVSIDQVVVRWSQALLAALEDRDRLREAIATVTHVLPVEHGIHVHVALWVNHAKAGTLILRTEEFEVFRAALEEKP